MDLQPAWSQSCVCGRAFSVPTSLYISPTQLPEDKEAAFGCSCQSGGIKTQKGMVKAWKASQYFTRVYMLNYVYLNKLQEFVEKYRKNGSIKDDIVDEHSLLLFIQFSAERPKRNRVKQVQYMTQDERRMRQGGGGVQRDDEDEMTRRTGRR
jgi:hypothetical protein